VFQLELFSRWSAAAFAECHVVRVSLETVFPFRTIDRTNHHHVVLVDFHADGLDFDVVWSLI